MLVNQQRQKAQESVNRPALSERTQPEQFALMLTTKSIEHLFLKVRPGIEVVPVEPDHGRLVNMRKALQSKGRLCDYLKWLASSDKSQEGFFSSDSRQAGRAALALGSGTDMGITQQPDRAFLNEIEQSGPGRNLLVFIKGATAVMLSSPIGDALPR